MSQCASELLSGFWVTLETPKGRFDQPRKTDLIVQAPFGSAKPRPYEGEVPAAPEVTNRVSGELEKAELRDV